LRYASLRKFGVYHNHGV